MTTRYEMPEWAKAKPPSAEQVAEWQSAKAAMERLRIKLFGRENAKGEIA